MRPRDVINLTEMEDDFITFAMVKRLRDGGHTNPTTG